MIGDNPPQEVFRYVTAPLLSFSLKTCLKKPMLSTLYVLRCTRFLLRRLPTPAAKFLQSISSSKSFTSSTCYSSKGIPSDILDPVVNVAEKHLHNLVQAFCVQSPPEHQRLVPRLQITFKTFRDFHVLPMPPLFLRCVCSYRSLAESLPPLFGIQHSALRSLVCPFPSSPCNTTGVRSTQRRPCPTLLQQIPWHLFSHFRPSGELTHATPATRVKYFPCNPSPSP